MSHWHWTDHLFALLFAFSFSMFVVIASYNSWTINNLNILPFF